MAEREGQRGHVGPGDHFVRVAAEQVRDGRVRSGNNLVAAPAGRERAVRVGVRMHQVVAHGVNHALGHLRAPGSVEEDCRMTIHFLRQRGELRARPGHIEIRHC